MDTIQLKAEPRTVLGKKVKLLRRQGLVPANLYGHRVASRALQIPERVVEFTIGRASRAALFSLDIGDGEPRTVLVKEIQRHPTTAKPLHVDLYQVAMSEKLSAVVPLHFVGEAPAVRDFNGTLVHNLTEIEVEALPSDLPTAIDVDVSGLKTLDDAIHVRDLHLPSGVAALADPDTVIATVVPSAAAEAEAAEAAEAAEGAAAAAAEESGA